MNTQEQWMEIIYWYYFFDGIAFFKALDMTII